MGGRLHEDQPEPRFVEGSKVAAIGWHWSSRIVPYAICSIQTLPRAVAACRGIYCHPPVPISSSPLTSRGAAGWQWLGPSTWHPITWCFETSLMVLSGGQTRLLRCKLPVRRIKEASENFPPVSCCLHWLRQSPCSASRPVRFLACESTGQVTCKVAGPRDRKCPNLHKLDTTDPCVSLFLGPDRLWSANAM